MAAGALLVVAVMAAAAVPAPGRFQDPLSMPAEPLGGGLKASGATLIGVARDGFRTLAVGLRGLVVFSDDGERWEQASVPLQTDLVAVQLLDDRRAWASGHDYVILQSADGGASWQRQFDRDAAKRHLPAYYGKRIAAGESGLQRYLDEVRLNTDGEVSLPFLGIWFEDAKTGYAVGSFGMIVGTEDGGQTWTPWLHRIDNDDFRNLNSIRSINGQVYIAGEGGRVYRLSRDRGHFVQLPTGYNGTFFDIVGNQHCLIAFGLRGAAYRSTDGGTSWQAVETGFERSITAGAVLDGGRRIVLFSETGHAIESLDNGVSFESVPFSPEVPVYGAAGSGGRTYTIVGPSGVQTHMAKKD